MLNFSNVSDFQNIDPIDPNLDCGGSRANVTDITWWCSGVLVSSVGLIGFVGNTLALIVLSRPSLRDVFHQLLFALACFDILFIICGGINYTFRAFKAESDIFTYLFPKFIYPFTHIAMTGTIFMTVAISVERYLGLCHPLLSPHSRKAWFYILPVIVIAIALNIPKFLEIQLNFEYEYDKVSGKNETYPTYGPTNLRFSMDYIKAYIMWTRLLSTGLIPVTLLLYLNLRIVIDILSSSKKTHRFGSARRQRKEINLSLVLLCIVFVFFCCHASRIILNIYEFINMQKVEDCKGGWNPSYFWEAMYPISNFAKILNSSLNFFIYCLVGHTFRRELCRTLGFKNRNFRGDNFVSRRSSRFDQTLTTLVANKANGSGKNGSTASPDKTKLNNTELKGGQETPETANLITIEAKEDMIKVELCN